MKVIETAPNFCIEHPFEQPIQVKALGDTFHKMLFANIPYGNFWIAGGSVRDLLARDRVKDFDLFFADQNAFNAVRMYLNTYGPKVIGETANSVRLQFPATSPFGAVQFDLVKRYFPSALECIAQFDFTINCAAITREGYFYCHKNFFVDMTTKRLMVNALPFPVDSMRRIIKYVKRGYAICPGELLKVAEAIQRLPKIDPAMLATQEGWRATGTFYQVD